MELVFLLIPLAFDPLRLYKFVPSKTAVAECFSYHPGIYALGIL